jgi:serpin B
MAVANRLWGQKDYRFLDPFLKGNETHYGSGLETVDFVKDTEGSRKTINGWVEEQTKEKIKDILKPGILTELTRLVLTNAIYFKGDWAAQFDEKRTHEEEFRLSAEKAVRAKMMNRTGEYALLEEKEFQALALPYKGNALSMVVFLPRAADGLAAMEASLTPAALAAHLAKFAPMIRAERKPLVVVALPQFETTSAFKLNELLVAMGMRDAFDENRADFSGMNGAGPKDPEALHISAVVHKAYVKVNEEGTEAAAATAVVVGVRSAMPRTSVFRADHPFLFLIRENATGAILFLGRVADPTQKGE